MVDIIGPQQTILVTSRAEVEEFGKTIEKDDVEAVFWHMPFSHKEQIYTIAIHKEKYINELIKKSNIFIINFLPFDLNQKVIECDKLHGRHIDKFEKLDLLKIEADNVESCYLKEACAIMECQVESFMEYADYTVYIAKSIKSNEFYDVKRLFHVKKDLFTTTKI